MNKSSGTERTLEVEGQTVRCIELDGHRLWHCECAAFQERLARLHEGFCAHTAVAMMRYYQEQSDEDG